MSTANFKTMKDFPLIIAEDTYCKVCPECKCTNAEDADECENCGADLSAVSAFADDFQREDIVGEMQRAADEINAESDFFNVSVESGYYTGVQFYVEDKGEFLDEMDDEECQYEWGMDKDEALRRYEEDYKAVLASLQKAKENIGLTELAVMARFSNGEVMYSKIA